ncbi:NAD(P)(+) transhydrogenase (Re/Si-specific) subunit beta, partial [Thauera chlorobenzoica]
MTSNWFVNMAYFVVAVVFILGLKAMASPVSARRGIVWAGFAMVGATVVTFFTPGLHNVGLMVLAIVLGGGVAWYSGKIVKMTDMPQMVAIYNGMGGGAAAGIAAIELVRGVPHDGVTSTLLALGAIIGAVAFSGSCVAFAKLQGLMTKAIRLRAQNNVNFFLTLATFGVGLTVAYADAPGGFEIFLFFALALALGVVLVMPIGGADMPVVISLLNAFTGLAVGFKGFVIGNPALIVAGIVVG